MDGKDYYKILGLNKNSSQEEIKKAYRKMAHKHHPDKQRVENGTEKFIDAMEAYHVLSDPEKRKEYDRQQSAKNPAFSENPVQEAYPNYMENFEHGFGFKGTSDPFYKFIESFFGNPSGSPSGKNEGRTYNHRHYDDLLD